MKRTVASILKTPPETECVFCVCDNEQRLLYVGVVEDISNIRSDSALNQLFKQDVLNSVNIEVVKSTEKDLIKLFSKTISRKKPLYNVSLAQQKIYPHLKITSEEFPRLLVTRKIEMDKAEYFGAFLPETGVRFFLDFLNRTFRLRGCAIAIDGSFLSPCTQYYEKRCVAPCVASLCEKTLYDEFTRLAKLFLQNKREELKTALLGQLQTAADNLDFETATFWRDILLNIQTFWENKTLQIWLDDAVDSFEVEAEEKKVFIYLATQRGRKVLGRKTFVFELPRNLAAEAILSQVLWQFYQFHVPKEIRVDRDFPNRKFLANVLSRRENRTVKINVIKPDNKKKITERAFGRSKYEYDLQQIKLPTGYREIQNELKKELELKCLPKRIECFDVAHISGTNFVAAKAVWENGKFLVEENRYWFFGEENELKMLEKAVKVSYEGNNKLPDLVLVDGGKPQLNAAMKGFNLTGKRAVAFIGAVKPPNLHNQVSYFKADAGKKFPMKSDSEAMQILVRLRDEAHELANRIHRTQRDFSHFYELANVLPFLNEKERNSLLQKFGSITKIKQTSQEILIELFGNEKGKKIFFELNLKRQKLDEKIKTIIVPIRFDDPNGEARDLQPLRAMSKNK